VKAAIVFHYSRPHPGREAMAFETFGDALGFFGKLAADGACEMPVSYLPPAGGGMMIVHGDRERLLGIIGSEDFINMYYRAGFGVRELTYELTVTGDDAVAAMELWASAGSELGVM